MTIMTMMTMLVMMTITHSSVMNIINLLVSISIAIILRITLTSIIVRIREYMNSDTGGNDNLESYDL